MRDHRRTGLQHAVAGLRLPQADRLVQRWAVHATASVQACIAEVAAPVAAVGIAAVMRPVPALG